MKQLLLRNVDRVANCLSAAVRTTNVDRFFHKVDPKCPYHGGNIVAKTLKMHGVSQVFTLCGGHVSPVLTGCEEAGIRVVDTRHEASAAFAADAAARLTGIPGVCVVTAGPGLTNTVTAIKNAQMAETPLILIGGAAPTLLKGRGALQDIDQLSVFKSICKDRIRVTRVRHLQKSLAQAIATARTGVPGPVLLELPVDVLYSHSVVSEMAGIRTNPRGIKQRLTNAYINLAVNAVFAGASFDEDAVIAPIEDPPASKKGIQDITKMLSGASKPVIVMGSQATVKQPGGIVLAQSLALKLNKLGIPTFLGGMCRGLLGADNPLFFRQGRKQALKEADLIILAGAICDFRLDYGRSLNPRAKVVIVNRDQKQMNLNRGTFWQASSRISSDIDTVLGSLEDGAPRPDWIKKLREREEAEEDKMSSEGDKQLEGGVNPVLLFQVLDSLLTERSILIGDGGDFVGTASRILRPRKPLSWLDPGAYGTLGVGGGFALGAKTVLPNSEVWVLWGDGSSTYSLSEIEPSVRNKLPFIALIGNNGTWGQIERDQTEILGSAAGCVLSKSTAYHRIAEGYGAVGLLIEEGATRHDVEHTLKLAREHHDAGKTVAVNVILGNSDFRKGSISL